MKTPRVTVCIAAYNHERYLHDCIMSVVAQADEVPIEILVGDDQSTDRTEEIGRAIERRFPDIVRFIRHEPKAGPGGNYQALIAQARGEYVAHLDGDDYWLPGKLAHQVATLDANPRLSASYTNALCVSDDGTPKGIFNNPQPSVFGIEYMVKGGNFLNHSTMLYRASAKQEICDWSNEYLDFKIHLMLASRGDLSYGNFLGAAYRVRSSTSILSTQNPLIRRLYWDALTSFSPEAVSRSSRLSASADFLGWVFVRAVRERSPQMISEWWKVVSKAHDEGELRLASATVENVFRDGSRQLLSRMAGFLGGTRMRVMYWR